MWNRSHARQFLGMSDKPDVDDISGLSGHLDRTERVGTQPGSTVGTVTEICDYLRLLYGPDHCPGCSKSPSLQRG